MARIETVGRVGAAQFRTARANAAPDAIPAARALVPVESGRGEVVSSGAQPRTGLAEAGFIAQLLVSTDPALRPSRLERTRAAAELYAAAGLVAPLSSYGAPTQFA